MLCFSAGGLDPGQPFVSVYRQITMSVLYTDCFKFSSPNNIYLALIQEVLHKGVGVGM